MKSVVLDANAVMTFLEGRPGNEAVAKMIDQALQSQMKLAISLINWGEVYYGVWQSRGRATADSSIAGLDRLPIEICAPDREMTRVAAKLRARHKLPYADCFAAALAISRNAAIATADVDFKRVEHLIKILWLSPSV